MIIKLKNTLKHTAIYGLGNTATKLIGIILLPLYTKELSVSEYGVLGILEITIIILTQVLTMGQPLAFLRYHDLDSYILKRKSILFTQFSFVFALGLSFHILGQYIAPRAASFFSRPAEFTHFFKLCIYIIPLQIINILFLNVLRAKEKSSLYAIVSCLKFTTILVCNIYFVAHLRIGVLGILYSYLTGEIVMLILLIPLMLKEMTLKFDPGILNLTLSFGFPLIFVSLANILLNMGDRYILKFLVDYKEVGLYNLGYKFAGLMNMLLIQSFTLALLPIAQKMYGKEGDKRFYTKMMTYLMFVLAWTGLALSIFSREIIEIFTSNRAYWASADVVPFLVLAYLFSGAKSVANLGLYLTAKTNYIAYNTIGAMILNIGLNFILIPKFGMMGAAVATLLSFMVLFFTTIFCANQFYRIPYENSKYLKLILLSVILFLLSRVSNEMLPWLRIMIKVCLLTGFPFILYFFNFYENIEIETLKKNFLKIRQKLLR